MKNNAINLEKNVNQNDKLTYDNKNTRKLLR